MSEEKKHGAIYIPRGIEIERLESGRLHTTTVNGLPEGFPERPELMACDCCLQHVGHIWGFKQRGFCPWFDQETLLRLGMRRSIEFAVGGWGFCEPCFQLWKMSIPLLVARVLTINPDMSIEATARIYSILPDVLYGEPREWRSGQPRDDGQVEEAEADAAR